MYNSEPATLSEVVGPRSAVRSGSVESLCSRRCPGPAGNPRVSSACIRAEFRSPDSTIIARPRGPSQDKPLFWHRLQMGLVSSDGGHVSSRAMGLLKTGVCLVSRYRDFPARAARLSGQLTALDASLATRGAAFRPSSHIHHSAWRRISVLDCACLLELTEAEGWMRCLQQI